MIVSSFKSEYGVSVLSPEFKKMTWNEFSSLLSGLGPETPLARVAQIRLENDKDVLKHYTSAQHKIRNKWREKQAKQYSQQDMDKILSQFKEAFISMS